MRGLPISAVCLGLFACSSSSSSTTPGKDAGGAGRSPDGGDAHRVVARDGGDVDGVTPAVDGGHGGHGETDGPIARHDAALHDALHYEFDHFAYPEAAIPHDTGSDAPASPCAGLPDLSTYCAPAGSGGTSTGFYECLQGNATYSACSPGTVCMMTGAGGIACQTP